MVEMYDRFLSELLDKHAPLKKITVVDRPLNEWMTNIILALKAIRRKNELIWRKTRITINFNIYYDSCMAVKKAISNQESRTNGTKGYLIVKVTRRNCFLSYILYLVVKRSQCCQNILALLLWPSSINMFFIEKIHNIKMEFPLLEACLPAYSFVDIDTIMPVCTAVFDTFQPLSCDVFGEYYS